MKILVTGGAGFIGSNFIRYLLSRHADLSVINYDALTYAGNIKNLEDVKEQFEKRYLFVNEDICDRKQIRRIFQNHRINLVVNFAAESHVDRSITSSEIFVRSNVLGVQVLLDTALEFGVERFLQVSTDEIYGSLGEDEAPWTEEMALAPNNPYSASKAGAECLSRSYWKTYGVPVLVTRSADNYGPYQFPEKFIPTCITHASEGISIPLYGDGRNIRDWLFVEDHCRALAAVLLKGEPGNVYNIGANDEKRNIDIAHAILNIMGKSSDLIQFVDDRKGHDYRYSMNCSKIKEQLGWNADIEFLDGLDG